MKSNKEALDVIIDIEKYVPVDQIKFKDMEIWPLIRLELWKLLQHGSPSLAKKEFSFKDYYNKIKKRLSIYSEYFFYKFKNRYQKAPAVFLIAPSERTIKIEGKYYSRFSNSLQDLFKELNISFITLDLARKKMPVYGETHFIDNEFLMRSKINKIRKIFSREKELNEYWNKLENYIHLKFPTIKLNKKDIIDLSQTILDHQRVFEKILKKIEPKVCFLVCYYHPAAMGYIRAARKLRIKTVEIQHSQQDLNGMYAPWTKLPKNGYSLLPSYWWCWGNKSASYINNWSKQVYPEHQAITGGNPWVTKNVTGNHKIDYVYTDRFDDILENKINVLVALQPINPILSPNLIRAISSSPQNINWLIRLHPAIYNQSDEIKNQLENTNNKNVEIKYSSEIPLFNLLKKVDFLVTSWSSIAYEALPFGVHPIIIHPNGADLFEEYIGAKLFTYAPSPKDMVDTIMSNKSNFNFKEETPYIEFNREKMKKTIIDLMKE